MVTDNLFGKLSLLTVVLLLITWILVTSFVITVIWNVCLVDIITVLKPIEYWNAVGFLILAKLIKVL